MIVVLVGVLCVVHVSLAEQFGIIVANVAVWSILVLEGLGYLFSIIVPMWNGKAAGKVLISGWRRFVLGAWYSTVPWGYGSDWEDCFERELLYHNICFQGTCIWLCLHALPLVAVYILLRVLWCYLIIIPLWRWLILGLIVNIIWDKCLGRLSRWLKSGVGTNWVPKWVFGVMILLLACYIHPTSRMILALIVVWLFKWIIHWGLVICGIIGLIWLLCDQWDNLVVFMEDPYSSQWGKFLFWFVPTFILLWVLSPFAFWYWNTACWLLATGAVVFFMLGIYAGKIFVEMLWDWPRMHRLRELIIPLVLACSSFAVMTLLYLCLYMIGGGEFTSRSALFYKTGVAFLAIVLGWTMLFVAIRGLILFARGLDKRETTAQETSAKKKTVVIIHSGPARRARRSLSPIEKSVRFMVGWLFALLFWILAYAGFDLIPYEINKELGMFFFTAFLLLSITPCRETVESIWQALVVAPLSALWRYGLRPKLVTLGSWAKDKEEGLCPLVEPIIK